MKKTAKNIGALIYLFISLFIMFVLIPVSVLLFLCVIFSEHKKALDLILFCYFPAAGSLFLTITCLLLVFLILSIFGGVSSWREWKDLALQQLRDLQVYLEEEKQRDVEG